MSFRDGWERIVPELVVGVDDVCGEHDLKKVAGAMYKSVRDLTQLHGT